MVASSVHLADVDLAEAGAEGFQHEVGLGHGAVDLLCVADVEAEGCAGKSRKTAESSLAVRPMGLRLSVFAIEGSLRGDRFYRRT